jgi:uroporphyrinogen decarboxylase
MGKELVFQTLRHEKTPSVAWVPFAGVHAGKLKGYSAQEVLEDADKLYESLLEVHKLYSPDGMPIVFDLQLEAEILGCELLWAKSNPPSVKTHPLAGSEYKIPCKCLIPTKESGRIPMVLDVMNRVKKAVGDDTALYGLICGPFTLASHLRGSDIFMDMIMNEQYVRDLVEFCGEVCMRMTDFYAEAGMDIIGIVDPLVSQIAPEHFVSMLSPTFTACFDYVRSKGLYSSFFVCGNATLQLDVMCHTHCDCISVDENVDIIKAKETTNKYNITIAGNIPLTTVMLHGNQQDNIKCVVDLLDGIEHHNFILSPGCDMPYDTPIENTVAVMQAVKNTDVARAMVADYETNWDDIPVVLPDYANLKKPLLEVFTLDSESCAACTYMWNSVRDVKDKVFGDKIDIIEYKYTIKENIARTRKMGLTNLPTLVINGQVKWVSIIPSRDELVAEIEALL